MRTTAPLAALLSVACALLALNLLSRAPAAEAQAETAEAAAPTKLAVLWTSGDPDVAHRVGLMYAHATRSADWWDETTLVIWGPSARLLAADKNLQAKIAQMMEDGVAVRACVVCADSYGVTDDLRSMGIEVKPMGVPLTEMLKNPEWRVLTF